MTIRTEPFGPDRLDDLTALFATDPVVDDCWCTWFLMRVVDFHAADREAKRAAFCDLMATSDAPLGVIAYDDAQPVGWCAAGPRRRYSRALGTPTLRGRDVAEDDDVWLVTCFFVRPDFRGRGVTRALLEAATTVAEAAGVTAVEGFPDAARTRSERGARGRETVFDACGFEVVRRPSNARVIVRRPLTGLAGGAPA